MPIVTREPPGGSRWASKGDAVRAPGEGGEELTSFGPAMLIDSGNAQFGVQKKATLAGLSLGAERDGRDGLMVLFGGLR